ncbi:MAG TPA: hypothetical protein VF024_12115 [Solirubrobacteraceae bacterium]
MSALRSGELLWLDGDGERGRILSGTRLRAEQPAAPDDVVALIEVTTPNGTTPAGDSERIGDAVYLDAGQASIASGFLARAAGVQLADAEVVAERDRLRERVKLLEARLPCARCGNLPAGEASGAGDLCICPREERA